MNSPRWGGGICDPVQNQVTHNGLGCFAVSRKKHSAFVDNLLLANRIFNALAIS